MNHFNVRLDIIKEQNQNTGNLKTQQYKLLKIKREGRRGDGGRGEGIISKSKKIKTKLWLKFRPPRWVIWMEAFPNNSYKTPTCLRNPKSPKHEKHEEKYMPHLIKSKLVINDLKSFQRNRLVS